MTTPECAIGKVLNPKTCRYIKACRKGYSRNKDFKCVKKSNTSQKSIPVIKEKVKLLKDLFSNNGLVNSPITIKKSKYLKKYFKKNKTKELNNGLVNSPPLKSRSRSKHLKKTPKFHPSKLNDIPNLEPFRNPFEIELEQFIERNGEKLIKMTFGEAKAFARNEGFVLFSDKDKNIYKDLLVDYRNKISSPDSDSVNVSKKKLTKVRFKPSSSSAKNTKVLSKRESIAKMKEDAK